MPLDVGATMTMGVRLTAPVTASGGVVNLTTLPVTLLYKGAPFTQVAVENTAVDEWRFFRWPGGLEHLGHSGGFVA